MKPSAIYRKAARLIETGKICDTGGGSCCAIAEAMRPDIRSFLAWEACRDSAAVRDYVELFRPEDGGVYWGRQWGEDLDDPAITDCRVLALCFMACIAEDEERRRR